MPNTKPDLFFDEDGVCDACRSAEIKNSIDWESRKREFEELIGKHRGKNGKNYDCIVPVSGGKDSHFQVYVVKKIYKMNPLLVSFEATKRTPLGRKNLDNIKSAFGCDLMVFEKNPTVYKKMGLESFKRVGDHEWPNHLGIFTVPVRLSVQMGIPLVIWGENSQLEYGGPRAARMKNILDRRWLEEFGGLLGHRPEDLIGVDDITEEDLVSYTYPCEEALQGAGITGVYLGYYFKWDAKQQTELMQKHGFNVKEDGPVEGTYTNYENLDDDLVAIHDYMKFVKFGFGRATDHACIDIRNGRLKREQGIELVREFDGKLPKKAIPQFLKYFNITEDEYQKTVDSFTDKTLFITDEVGNLLRDPDGNIIKRYQDYGKNRSSLTC